LDNTSNPVHTSLELFTPPGEGLRGLEAIIADTLKPFREDVLDHATDKRERIDRFHLPSLGFVLLIPIRDVAAGVLDNPPHGNRGTGDILRDISG
jgi:hypothetical protein